MSSFVDQLYQKSTKKKKNKKIKNKLKTNHQWNKINDIRNLVYITRSTIIVGKLQQRPIFVNILVIHSVAIRSRTRLFHALRMYTGRRECAEGGGALFLWKLVPSSVIVPLHWWIFPKSFTNMEFESSMIYIFIKIKDDVYRFFLIRLLLSPIFLSSFPPLDFLYVLAPNFQSCYYEGSEFKSQ